MKTIFDLFLMLLDMVGLTTNGEVIDTNKKLADSQREVHKLNLMVAERDDIISNRNERMEKAYNALRLVETELSASKTEAAGWKAYAAQMVVSAGEVRLHLSGILDSARDVTHWLAKQTSNSDLDSDLVFTKQELRDAGLSQKAAAVMFATED